ncbi:hypothetical protein AB1Y20_020293 [Prymnesium parvum]|uniref:E3 ubiquitin-protein ligase n=1 Tax=Prymnesium parvum TaxID=97485 RepID=A0AB34JUA5_PRYPA
MAQPVSVQLGTPAGDALLLIPADHALVSGLPMLPWAQHASVNGVAMVSLHHFQAVRAFGPYLRFSKQPSDMDFARNTSVLYFKLNSAAWERILAAHIKAGLLEAMAEAGATTVAEYVDVFNSLQFNDWSDLELHSTDFAPCEPFAQPATAGVPGRPAVYQGRGARRRLITAAVAAQPGSAGQPGPAALKFLELTKLSSMEHTGEAQAFWELSYLLGMLGQCFTRSSRDDELSSVRLVAAALLAALRSRYQGSIL